MSSKRDAQSFESSMAEFERLVAKMEEGDMTLEQSLKSYERGMELSKSCQTALDKAEQRVQVLAQRDGEIKLEPFESDDDQT